MNDLKNVKVSEEVKEKLVTLQGKLQAERKKKITMSDVIEYLVKPSFLKERGEK